MVDGVDVRELDPDAPVLAPSPTYPSGPTSSPAPWRPTCRFGRPEATDEELWEALEVAQAAGFVQRDAPTALDSPIQQGGDQRFGRSAPAPHPSPERWWSDPEIYIFDDSFSALDRRHRGPPQSRPGALTPPTPPR